jgi:hypothetical protein
MQNNLQSRGSQSRRGARGRGGRGGGGQASTQTPTFVGGLVGGNYVPPPLPISIQRLIDGRTLKSVRVEYTPSGSIVYAVPVEGKEMPLHEWKAARESSVRLSALAEKRALFAGRVRDREIKDVSVPETFSTSKEVEDFLGALPEKVRKLVLMTNREFRALQGKKSGDESHQ